MARGHDGTGRRPGSRGEWGVSAGPASPAVAQPRRRAFAWLAAGLYTA